jgi:hypothetical protein
MLNASLVNIRRFIPLALWLLRLAGKVGGGKTKSWIAKPRREKKEEGTWK